jgi:hypothetical protein
LNITMKLTVDALVQSLRGLAHDLAEGVEQRYAEQLRRGEALRGAATDRAPKEPGKGRANERRR